MSIKKNKITLKKQCQEVLDTISPSVAAKLFNIFLLVLILLNIFFNIISTVDSINAKYENFFNRFELISVIIFTIEYILRVWCCTENPKYSTSIKGRFKYIFSPLMLIDLLAIFPFYITPGNFSLAEFRIFRMLRAFKILKELVFTSIVMLLILVVASSFLYYLESKNFTSIPDAMWWTILTLTTVGANKPITLSIIMGRTITALIAISGIGIFALLISILGSGFIEVISKKKNFNLSKMRRKNKT